MTDNAESDAGLRRYSVHRWHDGHTPKVDTVRWLPEGIAIEDIAAFAEALTTLADDASDHHLTSLRIGYVIEELFKHARFPVPPRGRVHRVIGVGLCSCGSTYTLRWMDRDEWWTDHQRSTRVDLGDDPDGDQDEIEAIAAASAAGHGYQRVKPVEAAYCGAELGEVREGECECPRHITGAS